MKYLVDANVLSEPTKPRPDTKAVDWLRTNESELVVDAVVIAEIWRGVDALDGGRKKDSLIQWFDDVRARMPCLDWTIETAIVWGELMNHIKRAAFTVGLRDTMIAASAKRHGLIVATRNVTDFTHRGVQVENPFG
jgi:predicted nucleic acid-binding protein